MFPNNTQPACRAILQVNFYCIGTLLCAIKRFAWMHTCAKMKYVASDRIQRENVLSTFFAEQMFNKNFGKMSVYIYNTFFGKNAIL